jgi:glycosyltransferase involved in cell wall biosynthesis
MDEHELTVDQLLGHTDLLQDPDTSEIVDRKLDAIIVPSARTAPYLVEAAGVAEELNTPLVVLASKRANRHDIIREIEDNGIVADMIAVDVPVKLGPPMPKLETAAMFAGPPFERRTDISMKRNLGLLLARSIGWQRIIFLDDDITVPKPGDLPRAAGALNHHGAVGLQIGGYPDNSVVCHARRELGEKQDTFVGGGALTIPTYRHPEAFFPNIYNEDWFFLLDDTRLRTVSLVGEVLQRPYDPFINPDRARAEELGDTLAEGLFALLSRGNTIKDALNDGYWLEFLRTRRRLIDHLLHKAMEKPDSADRDHMIAALKAARGRSFLIEPRLCVRFLLAWQRDRVVWSETVGNLPVGLQPKQALGLFGLGKASTVRFNRTGPAPVEPRLRQARRRLDSQRRVSAS